MTPDHQPPLFASAVLAWDGERVSAEPLAERYAARDSRCHRNSDPLWEQDAPRYSFDRSHRNLETRIVDLDAALDREHRERPKQLSAHEVAERVHEAGRIADDVLQRDPVLAAAIVVQAYVLWGQLPQDPRSTAREGPKARFGSVKAVLCAATARTAVLGVSGRSYAVAESRGRTRARWNGYGCSSLCSERLGYERR